MNLEEQKLTGTSVIHITDALNAGLLELRVKRDSYTEPMSNEFIIYVDKQERNNPSLERREYVFNLSRQLVYLYQSTVLIDGDEFVMKLAIENNEAVMKTYVIRNITDFDEDGNRQFATDPEIEELESIPIVLFEGENYIYTNYESDGMTMSLVYPKNTDANKMFLNNAIYYNHNVKKNGEFSLDDIYFKDAFTKTENKLNIEVDNAKIRCITSKNNKFSLDENGNLVVNSITTNSSSDDIIDQKILESDKRKHPVGSLEFNVSGTNPADYLLFGTWTLWGSGRVPVGVDTTQTEFNEAEKTGGEKNHILTTSEMPSHSHSISGGDHVHSYTGFIQCAVSSSTNYTAIAHKRYESDGASVPASMNNTGSHSHTVSSTGSSSAHNNLQPYITCYMWKRIA